MRTPILLALTALVACGPTTDDGTPAATAAQPGLDLALTGGLTEADHVEVAPGVFMAASVADEGLIEYHEQMLTPTPEGGNLLNPWEAPSPDDMRSMITPSASYCYNYTSDWYSDSTSAGSMFGGDPTWYGSATAYSYDYEFGPWSYDYNQASTYVYTSSPTPADYVYAYAYVYINGSYVGYVSQYVYGGRFAYAYGTWTAPCNSGSLNVRTSMYHYIYDYGGQYMSVGQTFESSVTCCPE